MNDLKKVVLQIAVLSVTVMIAACSSGGSSHSSTPVPDETVTGSVVQGPVADATVIADLNDNQKWDEATEVKTTTDENGDFNDLVIPADYGEYVLVSKGGTDTISGAPAMPMRAPKGAKNITPVTTLVASVPAGAERDSLVAKLATMAGEGGAYDDDPASEAGISPDFAALTKMVEKVVMLVPNNDQASVVSEIATGIKNADASANLSDTVADAAGTSIKATQNSEFAVADEAGFDTSLKEYFAKVEEAVNNAPKVNGKVVENTELVSSIDENVADADAELKTNLTRVVADVDELSLEYANGSEGASYLEASLSAFNNTGEVVEKADVELNLQIRDRNSERSAVFTISNAEVEIGANETTEGGAEINVYLDNAVLNVAATNMDGSTVSTESVTGPFEVITVYNNEVVIDLVAAQAMLTEQVAEDFGTIAPAGDYRLIFSADGAPIHPEAMLFTVE